MAWQTNPNTLLSASAWYRVADLAAPFGVLASRLEVLGVSGYDRVQGGQVLMQVNNQGAPDRGIISRSPAKPRGPWPLSRPRTRSSRNEMASAFENLMSCRNSRPDEYFDEPLILRAKGLAIPVNATLIPISGNDEPGKDDAQAESWQEVTVLSHVAQLVDAAGNPFEITGGMEIVKSLCNGSGLNKVYVRPAGRAGYGPSRRRGRNPNRRLWQVPAIRTGRLKCRASSSCRRFDRPRAQRGTGRRIFSEHRRRGTDL